MTTVNATNNTSNANNSNESKNTLNSQALDKDAFLKLLVTQLSNQDPMNPMEDKEFIAQMAQFSSLEQIQNMNETMKTTNELVTLIGYELAGQLSKQNEQSKEIIEQLISLNNAIKEYGGGDPVEDDTGEETDDETGEGELNLREV